jgi:hypothetical protein
MERAAANSAYAKLHEKAPYHDGSFQSWAKDWSTSHPYHYNDGVSIGVADHDLTPWDAFTTERDASPLPSGADDDQTPEL